MSLKIAQKFKKRTFYYFRNLISKLIIIITKKKIKKDEKFIKKIEDLQISMESYKVRFTDRVKIIKVKKVHLWLMKAKESMKDHLAKLRNRENEDDNRKKKKYNEKFEHLIDYEKKISEQYKKDLIAIDKKVNSLKKRTGRIYIRDELSKLRVKFYKKIAKKLNILYYPFCIKDSFFSKKDKIIIYTPHVNFGHLLNDLKYLRIKNETLKFKLYIFQDKKELPYLFRCEVENFKQKIFVVNKFNFIFYYLKMVYYFNKIIYSKKKSFKNSNNHNKYHNRYIFSKKINFIIDDKVNSLYENFLQKINLKDKKIITFFIRNNTFYDKHIQLERFKRLKQKESRLWFGKSYTFEQFLERENNDNRKLRNDNPRNVTSINFKELIQNNKEFQFIKVGYADTDNYLNQFNFNNFYDLSNSNEWSSELETSLVKNSYLTIAPESGTVFLPCLLNVPLIWMNCSHPLMCFPYQKNQISLMQSCYDLAKNSKMYLEDFFDYQHPGVFILRSRKHFYYKENTDLEIRYAFDYMRKKIENNFEKTEEELYIMNYLKKNIEPMSNNYSTFKKWFSNPTYIGEGTMMRNNLIK